MAIAAGIGEPVDGISQDSPKGHRIERRIERGCLRLPGRAEASAIAPLPPLLFAACGICWPRHVRPPSLRYAHYEMRLPIRHACDKGPSAACNRKVSNAIYYDLS
jgi:hypothetical protein